MLTVYRPTDRIPVRIGEATFWVSPVTYQRKMEIASKTKMAGGVEVPDRLAVAELSVRASVKRVDGVALSDGSPLELHFDGDLLTDESFSMLMQLTGRELLVTACACLMNGIEKHDIPGVVIDLDALDTGVKKS